MRKLMTTEFVSFKDTERNAILTIRIKVVLFEYFKS